MKWEITLDLSEKTLIFSGILIEMVYPLLLHF